MPANLLMLGFGLAQIALGLIIFHRITPVALQKGKASAWRTIAFGLALALFGGANAALGLGYASQGGMMLGGQLCLALGALLWVERLFHSDVRGWADAGRRKAAEKGARG